MAGLGSLIAYAAAPSLALGQPAVAAEEPGRVSADDALSRLLDGNARYVAAKAEHPGQTAARRDEVAKGQHPFAVILGCADSRVAPELLFDQGLGDLFVVRVAGNVADDAIVGSIEYAVEHLHAPLVMVLGHERCGAVAATLDLIAAGGTAPGHLVALTDAITPAAIQARAQPGDVLDTAVIANVGLVTAQLKRTGPVLSELVHEGQVKVVGARYDLDTGEVEVVA